MQNNTAGQQERRPYYNPNLWFLGSFAAIGGLAIFIIIAWLFMGLS